MRRIRLTTAVMALWCLCQTVSHAPKHSVQTKQCHAAGFESSAIPLPKRQTTTESVSDCIAVSLTRSRFFRARGLLCLALHTECARIQVASPECIGKNPRMAIFSARLRLRGGGRGERGEDMAQEDQKKPLTLFERR